MAITDKTRKILWGRSGNRCAICRQRLVVDETSADSESVVGDECHIISGAANGPRHDPGFDSDAIDDLDNLILLCRVHHKMIDDQCETYQADLLRQLKAKHEKWIEVKLDDENKDESIRIIRSKNEIPKNLALIESGYDLFNMITNCHGSYLDHASDLDEDEIELVGGFLQNLSDWIDIADGLEPINKVRARKDLHDELKALAAKGFLVFVGTESQTVKGGTRAPSKLLILHVKVARSDDTSIFSFKMK